MAIHMDHVELRLEDLHPHPTEKRRAGSQPSCSPSEFAFGSYPLERDEYGEILQVERVEESQVQHYSPLLGKAELGKPDAGLPEH